MRHELVNKGEPVGFDPPTRLFYLVYLARILCIDCKQHQTSKRFERKKCTYMFIFLSCKTFLKAYLPASIYGTLTLFLANIKVAIQPYPPRHGAIFIRGDITRYPVV